MTSGTLYGIGIGPGDPELLTLKGARLLKTCPHIFVPKARTAADSLALSITQTHIGPQAQIHEVVFPMTPDKDELRRRWDDSARQVAEVLRTGADACFLTLGDAFLYSTYIYLLRALKRQMPEVKVVTVPGVNAFSAAAALAEFPVGEAKEPVTIIPTSDDFADLRAALRRGGTVVLMKIGKRLREILALLEETGTLERAVLVARAGLDGQHVVADLRKLKEQNTETEYLAVILVHASKEAHA